MIETTRFDPPPELARRRGAFLVVGIVGLLVAGLGWFLDPAHFFQGYLVAFLFWACITLGCVGLEMLHHLTRGAWGLMIRRPLEAAGRTLPLLAVLFVPLAFGMGDLYHWSHPEVLELDPVLRQKGAYLNSGFWVGRAIGYFAVWLLFAFVLDRLSRRQDETGDPALFRRLQGWSAVGFLLLAITLTFASIDWLMSLDPHWFSSLFGLWFFTGTGLSGLAFSIVVAYHLSRYEPMASTLRALHFHDYGKLLMAFVMLWAYLSFSQFLLIWSGDLPEEIPFYLHRFEGGWMVLSVVLLLGHFVLPFLLLLSADLKQKPALLAKVALLMLVMRWVDLYWSSAPTLAALHEDVHPFSGLWIDIAAVVGLGGVWLWWFVGELVKRPLLPVNDPYLPEALADV